ncbi:MAG: hypothetical protein WC980_06800 [Candidatus Brocadiia bacterium]
MQPACFSRLVAAFLLSLILFLGYGGACEKGSGNKKETGSSGLPDQVTAPYPADGAINVSLTTLIYAIVVDNATSYDIYFGTASPGTFVRNQPGTSYHLATLVDNTKYYWRIDSKNAVGTITGTVWSFTTMFTQPAQAASPAPADGATGTPDTQQLSWAPADRTTSYDVYFGITSAGWAPVTNTAATSYDPGTLTQDVTYYWRVDSKNSVGTAAGNVWSFTTLLDPPPQVTSPVPADGSTNILDAQQLSWSSAARADSYDVYFGITTAGWAPVTNTAATNYDPGTLPQGVTYYWRIDPKNSAGATAGLVWSFSTVSWLCVTCDSVGDVGYNTSIAIDSNNNAHISYYDLGYGDLKYAVNETGDWVCTTIDSIGDTGHYTSIALDANNKAHISYFDNNNKILRYATNVSGSWVCVTVDPTYNVGYMTSIALDSNNKAHISYYNLTNGDLKYANNALGAWVCATVDSADDVGYYTSIAVDSNNKVHISYQDYTNKDLKYATNASGSWVCATVDSDGLVGDSTSIDIDSGNKAHITYINSDALKYATNVSGAWVCAAIEPAGQFADCSLALDSDNKAHISYYDATGSVNNNLKYATNILGFWVCSVIDSTGTVGEHTSIAVDSTNKSHISYYDGNNGNLKYATDR